LLAALLALALGALPTSAAPPAAPQDADLGGGWYLQYAPYVWLSTIDGSSDINGRSVDVDLSYDDVFNLMGDHLSLLAGMLHLELGHDRIFGFVDVVASRLDTDKGAQLDGIEDPGTGLSTSRIDTNVELRLDSVIFEFGGGYQVLRMALPQRTKPLQVEFIAGGRYYYTWASTHATASTRIVGLPEGSPRVARAVTAAADLDWVDPFVGGRFSVPITNDIDLWFRGDIGGFGLGSELAWSLVSGFKYAIPWEPVDGVGIFFGLGYKILSYDYDKDGVELDLTYQGPVTAIGLDF
jgi:hypothetical protein